MSSGILFLESFPVLFVNEGCAMKDYDSLGEAKAGAAQGACLCRDHGQ